VAGETWHGKQVGTFLPDGSYVLEFDYDKDPELIMDVLKHGPEVEVLEPLELKKKVKDFLATALKRYS
jgi:predicted DNA-binding transcriptional regulator YafY